MRENKTVPVIGLVTVLIDHVDLYNNLYLITTLFSSVIKFPPVLLSMDGG